LMPSLQRCLSKQAKKALIDDLKRLVDALAPFAKLPVLEFCEAAIARIAQPTTVTPPAGPGTAAIENYVLALAGALRDEARFTQTFSRLKKELKAPAAKRLALQFTKGRARTKAEAFNLIWGRHQSVIGTAARAEATGGRTAA